MLIKELFEDGRIVKGVNTTLDVRPNEIKTQAAKFGNKVDKDGRPPTLSKKVRGSKTNVLFNLAMTEGIKLRLERDKDIDVLHIMDTKDKQRIEVRGKKGYETGGYDANDKLHQVLDRVGKAANIAELINGEVVSINPNHPQGTRAIRTAQDVLQTEASGPRMDPKDVEFDLLDVAEKRRLAGEYKKLGPELAVTTWGAGLAQGIANYLGGRYLSALERFLLKQGTKRFTEMELACIEGGHDVSDLYEKPTVIKTPGRLFTQLQNFANSYSLKEALGEIASTTEIYVDMDGVLADFFGEWAKLMNVDSFRDIENPVPALEKIRATDDFWLKLPLLPEAKNLLGLIKQVKGSYSICTSPLADDPNSEPHKMQWIKKNLAFFPPTNIHITHDKPQYATQKDGTPNILIDDYGVNINAWEAAGGYGFKYKDHKFERTAKAIKQHMQEPVDENFADGKKKGKSRPGRVKRSGASCNGSVTALRKRAKNASGEKAKMYHWCANMKSGRKKK